MDFEGQYLTYDEYKSLGGSLDNMPFNLLEFEARKQIDRRTQNRLKNVNEDDIPEAVKICVFNLISKIQTYAETTEKTNANVASENIDGYSVSYITPMSIREIVKSKESELLDVMDHDLFGVIVNNQHLIYAGVKC